MKSWKDYLVCIALVLLTCNAYAQSQTEKDLENLRTWMKKKAAQGDSLTKAEWPAIRGNFRTKSANLDRSSGNMSLESKEDYNELKTQYKTMEAKHGEQYGEPLNREEAERWKKELTGRTNLKRIKADELRDIYVYFLEGVRGQRAQWSLRDWEYAEHVYLELNNRKQAVLDKLSNSDKLKIAALQVEFNALRKSRDAKDKYEEMRDKG